MIKTQQKVNFGVVVNLMNSNETDVYNITFSNKISEEPKEEQKEWLKQKLHSEKIIKKEIKADIKPEEVVHKYSNKTKGQLRESVIIVGVPYFIKYYYDENKGKYFVQIEYKVEEATKILIPPQKEEYPYEPYEFKDVGEPNYYLQRAKKESVDSIYQKIKSIVRKFNDIDEKTVTLLSANILGSYFQDRFSTVHYLIIVGDNGTGKSAFGETFECLEYRPVNITNATEAFWFRIFGTNEPGQVTIIAQELDKLDQNSNTMGMLKMGYQPNAKVPRMNTDNVKMEFYYPFGFKILIAEKSPSEHAAKCVLDRSFKFKTYKGYPEYKIKEIGNPQGNTERQRLV